MFQASKYEVVMILLPNSEIVMFSVTCIDILRQERKTLYRSTQRMTMKRRRNCAEFESVWWSMQFALVHLRKSVLYTWFDHNHFLIRSSPFKLYSNIHRNSPTSRSYITSLRKICEFLFGIVCFSDDSKEASCKIISFLFQRYLRERGKYSFCQLITIVG